MEEGIELGLVLAFWLGNGVRLALGLELILNGNGVRLALGLELTLTWKGVAEALVLNGGGEAEALVLNGKGVRLALGLELTLNGGGEVEALVLNGKGVRLALGLELILNLNGVADALIFGAMLGKGVRLGVGAIGDGLATGVAYEAQKVLDGAELEMVSFQFPLYIWHCSPKTDPL